MVSGRCGGGLATNCDRVATGQGPCGEGWLCALDELRKEGSQKNEQGRREQRLLPSVGQVSNMAVSRR
ncbi:hypothetical protein IF2G_10071 [Cordyceps javanica]|nr:hypothetical protein IF2G_10071 [Cordyceps javanica]